MDDIYKSAVRYFGIASQCDKAVEELSELMLAIIHHKNGKASDESVAAEIADVEIMCAQLRFIFGDGLVEHAKQKKLVRLESMIS